MKDFQSRFNRTNRLVSWFIGVTLVLIVSAWIVTGILVYKAVKVAGEQDWSGGIKPVLEQLWCGKTGCK